jgi:hypothetical protein
MSPPPMNLRSRSSKAPSALPIAHNKLPNENEKREQATYFLHFSFDLSMDITLFPVRSSTLARVPFVSLITPATPLLGPLVTMTGVPINLSRGPRPIIPEPTIPPPIIVGFIFERSPVLRRLPLGARETKERARVTKTPLFSVTSLLCRKA